MLTFRRCMSPVIVTGALQKVILDDTHVGMVAFDCCNGRFIQNYNALNQIAGMC